MVGYLHSIFLRHPWCFWKNINSGINFLAFGPAGFLNDQQYGSVWAWSGNANPSPNPLGPQLNPLGRWAPTAKSLLIETLDDALASFTNLMYWLDWGEFPKTTIFERWKEHLSDRQNEKWTIVGGFAFGVPASLCKALDHFVYHSCTIPIGNEDIHRNPKFGFFKAGMHIFSH